MTSFLPSSLYDVRNVDGIRFGVRLAKPEDYMIAYGSHEGSFMNVKPKVGDTVIDVGAHIGSYTLRYSRVVGNQGHVTAFEPEPENRRFLVWNLRLNTTENVTVRKEALGDSTGTLRFGVGGARSGIPLPEDLLARPLEVRHHSEISVPVVRLDDLGFRRVDFIKIDVEEYEMNVLRGGERTISSSRPKMFIEVHNSHTPNCQTCCWLEEKGFSVDIIGTNPSTHWIKAS